MRPFLLVAIAAVYGIAGAWLFRRFNNPARTRATVNRVIAHILELRLFVDEPRLLFRAQRDLLFANFRLLRLMAVPVILLAIPFAALYVPLDRYFGSGPLRTGDEAIAEVRSVAPDLNLTAPAGGSIETLGLRVPREKTTLWRVRAIGEVQGDFRSSDGRRVRLHTAPARFLGMPWVVALAVVSMLAGLAGHVLLQKLHAFERD